MGMSGSEIPHNGDVEKNAAEKALEIRDAKREIVIRATKVALQRDLPEFKPMATPPDDGQDELEGKAYEEAEKKRAAARKKAREQVEEQNERDWQEEQRAQAEREKQEKAMAAARKKAREQVEEQNAIDWEEELKKAEERQKGSMESRRGNVALEKKGVVDPSLVREAGDVQDKKKYELYDARKYPGLSDKANYLRREYGIGIVYGADYNGDSVHIQKSLPASDILALDSICKAINLLPREFTKNLANITFIFGSKIKVDRLTWNPDGIQMITPKGMAIAFVASSQQMEGIFFHEIFHGYDSKFNQYTKDDSEWIKKSGIEKSDYVGDQHRGGKAQPMGFSRSYGRYNVYEDQATMAEDLFDKVNINKLFERAKTDIRLRVKIGLMTACLFDVTTGRFSRMMTKEEYQKFSGFRDYKYFYAWSAGRMDHRYWNAIADGRPMKF